MAVYEYRCPEHGDFDLVRPFGEAPRATACGECGREATRVYSVAVFKPSDRAIVGAMDRAEKSRTEPDVVSSVPTKGRRSPGTKWATDPRQLKLPRP